MLLESTASGSKTSTTSQGTGLAYTGGEFIAGIIKGLVFMAEHQGTYQFHI
jgi:hypothetical protein